MTRQMCIRDRLYEAQNYGDFRKKEIAKLYRFYQNSLKSSNALDFDDIIRLTVVLLEENPDILEYYQNRFRYILVDEYQDTKMCIRDSIQTMPPSFIR